MKILLVNKFHYLRGGDCKYVFELAELLKKHGHEVRHFSAHHPQNFKYEYDNDFVSYMDFAEELKKPGLKLKFKVMLRMLYSGEARTRFEKVLVEFKPDIIHLNNIHKHLTTSILLEANKQKVPVVWTLHDFNLICPNISFISKNKICERCKKLKYVAPIKEKCSNNSLAASAVIAVEKLLHDVQQVRKRVNIFIAPSQFLKNKFVEYGFAKQKIEVLPNFYEANKHYERENDFGGKYYFYLGRISAEKGVETLCKAVNGAGIKLILAGEGPLKNELEKRYGSRMIRFVGYKSGKQLWNLRKRAWFLVLPSECYENNPFSIIEAFADGVPAIASNLGGIPELVQNNKTGFLFEAGDVKQLTNLLKKTFSMNKTVRNKLGENGRTLIKNNNDPEIYYKKLLQIYNKAIVEEKAKWKRQ
jgi:glycosyltransferase involved in cell wall biosynthesis